MYMDNLNEIATIALNGDNKAMLTLHSKVESLLYAWIVNRRGGNSDYIRQMKNDISQHLYLWLNDNIYKWDPTRGTFFNFIYTYFIHIYTSAYEQYTNITLYYRKKGVKIDNAVNVVVDPYPEIDDKIDLKNKIKKIEEHKLQLIVQMFDEGYNQTEIAKEIGQTPQNISLLTKKTKKYFK